MTTTLTDRLIDHWKQQRLAITAGVSIARLSEFEASHGISIPPDFRDYLLAVNGMSDGAGGYACDGKGYAFWPLQDIRPVSDYAPRHDMDDPRHVAEYFVFADYLQESWSFAICLTPGGGRNGHVMHVERVRPKLVAHSFRAFVEAYLVDSQSLYPDESTT